jgi:hypothetical protein
MKKSLKVRLLLRGLNVLGFITSLEFPKSSQSDMIMAFSMI